MIEYKEFGSELTENVYRIYEENKWICYLYDKEKLSKAYERSLYILGAFDNGRLVGFVRCVGDAEYIIYVQDLIVKPSYQRKGIGKELMRQVFAKFPDAGRFVLITDKEDKSSNAFYKAIGMTTDLNGCQINTYCMYAKRSKR